MADEIEVETAKPVVVTVTVSNGEPSPVIAVIKDNRWKIFWIVGVLSLVADQLSKIYARAVLPVSPKGCAIPEDFITRKCGGVTVKFLGDVWEWRLSMNPGSAFGLFGS